MQLHVYMYKYMYNYLKKKSATAEKMQAGR